MPNWRLGSQIMRVLFLLLPQLLPVSAPRAAELTLDAASTHIVAVEINGHPLNLRVDPGNAGYIILNPAAARKAGLNGSLIGSTVSVGPVRLAGKTNRVSFKVGVSETKQRVVWNYRDVIDHADGVISPAILPFDSVTLHLRKQTEKQSTLVLPVRYDHGRGLFFPLELAGKTIAVRLSTLQPLSMATASAGAILAGEHDGSWTGEPRTEHIRFGISRPVRPMTLQRPVNFDSLRIQDILVRTSDNPGQQLPPEPTSDPDEIVVRAKAQSKQPATLLITLGYDRLTSCSSISYRRASQAFMLQCDV